MASDGTVTCWIDALKDGDREAAQPLWETYFQRLVALARSHLRGTPRRAADEEDVALSAFDSLCRAVEQGRFPRLEDRDDLWQVLYVITVRKACDLAQHEGRARRGGGKVQDLGDLVAEGAIAVAAREPDPELAAQVAEECRRLLARLNNDTLRSVALWKMEGYTNEEIAAKLGCVRYTVDRKLKAIRDIWSSEEPSRP
jgi:DNA-directed RNA polymerase specialized sigma24 family protein